MRELDQHECAFIQSLAPRKKPAIQRLLKGEPDRSESPFSHVYEDVTTLDDDTRGEPGEAEAETAAACAEAKTEKKVAPRRAAAPAAVATEDDKAAAKKRRGSAAAAATNGNENRKRLSLSLPVAFAACCSHSRSVGPLFVHPQILQMPKQDGRHRLQASSRQSARCGLRHHRPPGERQSWKRCRGKPARDRVWRRPTARQRKSTCQSAGNPCRRSGPIIFDVRRLGSVATRRSTTAVRLWCARCLLLKPFSISTCTNQAAAKLSLLALHRIR